MRSAARADDYRIPSYPYLLDRARPACRSTAGSRTHARAPTAQSLGGSYIFDGGFVGVAVTQNNALYRIPGIDGDGPSARASMRAQTKVTGKGEYRPQAGGIDAVRFWFGHTDYKHNEIGLPTRDPATDGVRQTFTNKEQEGRVEVQLSRSTCASRR